MVAGMSTPEDGFPFSEPQPPFDWNHAAKRWSGQARSDLSMSTFIHRALEDAMREETDQMQEMIERMLVSSELVGIIIVNDHHTEGHLYDNTYRLIHDRHLILSPHAPFGVILEFRTVDDYNAWQASGHPIRGELPKMLTDGEDGPISA